MNCAKCSVQNETTASFCYKCGAAFISAPGAYAMPDTCASIQYGRIVFYTFILLGLTDVVRMPFTSVGPLLSAQDDVFMTCINSAQLLCVFILWAAIFTHIFYAIRKRTFLHVAAVYVIAQVCVCTFYKFACDCPFFEVLLLLGGLMALAVLVGKGISIALNKWKPLLRRFAASGLTMP